MSVLVFNKLKILSLLYTVIVCSFFFFGGGGGSNTILVPF